VNLSLEGASNVFETREVLNNDFLENGPNLASFKGMWVWNINEEKMTLALENNLFSGDAVDIWKLMVCAPSKLFRNFLKMVCVDVSLALEYLHDHRYAHQDVKLENIFISADSKSCSAVLGDFDRLRQYEVPKVGTRAKSKIATSGEGTMEFNEVEHNRRAECGELTTFQGTQSNDATGLAKAMCRLSLDEDVVGDLWYSVGDSVGTRSLTADISINQIEEKLRGVPFAAVFLNNFYYGSFSTASDVYSSWSQFWGEITDAERKELGEYIAKHARPTVKLQTNESDRSRFLRLKEVLKANNSGTPLSPHCMAYVNSNKKKKLVIHTTWKSFEFCTTFRKQDLHGFANKAMTIRGVLKISDTRQCIVDFNRQTKGFQSRKMTGNVLRPSAISRQKTIGITRNCDLIQVAIPSHCIRQYDGPSLPNFIRIEAKLDSKSLIYLDAQAHRLKMQDSGGKLIHATIRPRTLKLAVGKKKFRLKLCDSVPNALRRMKWRKDSQGKFSSTGIWLSQAARDSLGLEATYKIFKI